MSIFSEVSVVVLYLRSLEKPESGSIVAYQIKGKEVQTNMQASKKINDLIYPLTSGVELNGQILKLCR